MAAYQEEKIRILLIRHGEFEAQENPDIYNTKSEIAIPLTQPGVKQVNMAAKFMKSYYQQPSIQAEFEQRQQIYNAALRQYKEDKETLLLLPKELKKVGLSEEFSQRLGHLLRVPEFSFRPPPVKPVQIFNSPLLRAVQTTEIIASYLGDVLGEVREKTYLREKNFGPLAGQTKKDLKKMADEFPLFKLIFDQANIDRESPGGKYYNQPFNGESDAMVVSRVKDMTRDLEEQRRNGNREFVIVSHGMTQRAFCKTFLKQGIDFIENTPNPGNAEIWKIEGTSIKDYELSTIFTGKRSEIEALERPARQR